MSENIATGLVNLFDPDADDREHYLRSLDPELVIDEDLDNPATVDVAIDRCIEKLAEQQAEAARNSDVAARRIDMIRACEQDVNGRLERQSGWLLHQIEAW